MLRKTLLAIMLVGILAAFGCSGNPTSPANDVDQFFGTQGPQLTGIVGDYTYTGKDGSFESGKLTADENGRISLVPDRGASVFSNYWFDIDIEYLSPRGYTAMGLPYYYLGDTFTYKIAVDYKRGFNLAQYPLIYAKLTSSQRYYPSMALLPGQSIEVWNPFLLSPYENVDVYDTFTIVSGTVPGNDATVIQIDMEFFYGVFQFNLAQGVCGLWDP